MTTKSLREELTKIIKRDRKYEPFIETTLSELEALFTTHTKEIIGEDTHMDIVQFEGIRNALRAEQRLKTQTTDGGGAE